MWFKNCFKSLISNSSHRRPARRRPPPARLCLEALEDRFVPSYTIIDLGGAVADINASAQVVGRGERAFVWQNGVRTDLGTLGGGTEE